MYSGLSTLHLQLLRELRPSLISMSPRLEQGIAYQIGPPLSNASRHRVRLKPLRCSLTQFLGKVNASQSEPPIESISMRAICSAVRCSSCPLNTMCSTKCERPVLVQLFLAGTGSRSRDSTRHAADVRHPLR